MFEKEGGSVDKKVVKLELPCEIYNKLQSIADYKNTDIASIIHSFCEDGIEREAQPTNPLCDEETYLSSIFYSLPSV